MKEENKITDFIRMVHGFLHLMAIMITLKNETKMIGNDIGGLAGLDLGHLQVHARNGEDKHTGLHTNLLINMHGLDKPTCNANMHGVYKHTYR